MPDEPVEIVALRAVATVPALAPPTTGGPGAGPAAPARRAACFDGEWSEVDVRRGEGLAEGARLAGPCVVELADATCVVAPDWVARVDGAGALVMERSG